MKYDLKDCFGWRKGTKLTCKLIDTTPINEKIISFRVFKNAVEFEDNSYNFALEFSDTIIHSCTTLSTPVELSKFEGLYDKVIMYKFDRLQHSLLNRVCVHISDSKIVIDYMDVDNNVKCNLTLDKLEHTVTTTGFPDDIKLKELDTRYNTTYF